MLFLFGVAVYREVLREVSENFKRAETFVKQQTEERNV